MDFTWFDFIARLALGGLCVVAFVACICIMRNVKNDLYLDNLKKQIPEFFNGTMESGNVSGRGLHTESGLAGRNTGRANGENTGVA